jgi:hypothetical protein
LLSGCASPFLNKHKTKIVTASDSNPVVRAVCLWQPAEGPGLDGLPGRGFAGQIIFLTQQSPTPVKVNDDIRIYLFDDQGSAEDQAKPIHQFEFLGGACNRYLQVTNLGPSYQLFIPYVRSGDHEARCSLRVALQSGEQPIIFSDMIDVLLPGKTPGKLQNVQGTGDHNALLDFAAIKQSLPSGHIDPAVSPANSFEWSQTTNKAMQRAGGQTMETNATGSPGMKTYSIPFDDGMMNY